MHFFKVINALADQSHVVSITDAVPRGAIPAGDAACVTDPLRAHADEFVGVDESIQLAMIALLWTPCALEAKDHRVLLFRVVLFRQANEHFS
jgi:hypothetical protein